MSSALADWKGCPRCGQPLALHDATDDVHVTCAACGFLHYDNPAPATVVLILDDQDRLLLIRRAVNPYAGEWDTPGGFLTPGESAEDCARREVREELGCDIVDLVPLGTFPSRYGDGGRWTIGIAFTAKLAAGATIALDPEESLEHAWTALDAIPHLAFPDGRDAVAALIAARD
ncbi:MAG TPA: NUDIX domain-containing protein [Solirubrobacteraceae bacterium]|nr:NUDIX domain-containing protein [Solirubrobacteraceae bacterium]